MRKKPFLRVVLHNEIKKTQFILVKMEKNLAYLVFDLQCIAISTSFLFGFYFVFIKRYFLFEWDKLLVTFCFIAFLTMIPFFFKTHGLFKISYINEINNGLVFLNYTFITSFIHKHLKIDSKRQSYLIHFFNFLILSLMLGVFFSQDAKSTEMKMKAFSLNHFGLISMSLIYLFFLSKNLPEISIMKLPDFWIVLGIVSCSLINFPIMLTLGYFFDVSLNSKLNYLVSSINPLGYFVQYSLMTYSFLCNQERAK